ncbi:MAG: hypothetical protein GDA36_05505 [Rhodobacteraceae bacterium]|nr:hypothetical protein [Paracoccaceae bacterium]
MRLPAGSAEVLYRGIGIAQSLKQRLQISLPPRCSEARRGHDGESMTGGRSHDPVTAATAQGPLSANARPRVRPFDHGIKPGGARPGAQVWCFASARVDLPMKLVSFGPRSGAQSRWISSCRPAYALGRS